MRWPRPTSRASLGGVGGFAGLFTPSLGDPLLAAGCDGVGTKILLGKQAGRFHGLGVDLVAMCVNDVLTSGARPAFFLDVITCGKVDPGRGWPSWSRASPTAAGRPAARCSAARRPSTPDMMAADDFDMAGFCVGGCERRELVVGRSLSGRRRGDRAGRPAVRTRTASR